MLQTPPEDYTARALEVLRIARQREGDFAAWLAHATEYLARTLKPRGLTGKQKMNEQSAENGWTLWFSHVGRLAIAHEPDFAAWLTDVERTVLAEPLPVPEAAPPMTPEEVEEAHRKLERLTQAVAEIRAAAEAADPRPDGATRYSAA